MRAAPRTAVAVAAAGVLLVGCAGGAVIKPPSVNAGSKFCTDVGSFATQAIGLNDAAGESRAQLLQVLPGTVTSLKSLQAEAPVPDTVNGKSLKTDIGTMAGVYQDVVDALQSTSNVRAALSAVNTKDGQAFTDATGRFDDYAGAVCKVNQAVPGAATTTTAAQTGPTAP
jgi:hypothetical protein